MEVKIIIQNDDGTETHFEGLMVSMERVPQYMDVASVYGDRQIPNGFEDVHVSMVGRMTK